MTMLQEYTVEQLRQREKELREECLQLSYAPARFRGRRLGEARRELGAIVIELGNRGKQPRYL